MVRKPYLILLLLFGISILLRWGTFFPSVINHDESTYIVIADEILRGETYLRESVDTKPVGLFWLYAGMNWISGGSIFGLRLITTFFVALTAFFLFLSGKHSTGSERVGWAAALAYPVMVSIFTYYGVSPNTELFLNAFTAAAIWLAIPPLVRSGRVLHGQKEMTEAAKQDNNPLKTETLPHPQKNFSVARYALVGLLLGLATIIKPVVAAEALAIGLFLLWWGWKYDQLGAAILRACTPMTLVFTLPLLGVVAYYSALGMIDEMVFYNWELSKRYPVDKVWYMRLKFMGDYALRYSPLLLLGIAALMEKKETDRSWQQFLLLQLGLVSLIVLAPGKSFGHYQVQLSPALAALAATWWLPSRGRQAFLRRLPIRRGLFLLFVTGIGFGISQFVKYHQRVDQAELIAEWFNNHLEEEDSFLMVNNNQIVYHLTDRPAPTPYVHGSLLFFEHHIRALGLDVEAETEKFKSNPELRYAVVPDNEFSIDHPLMNWIREDFTAVHQVDDRYTILKRKP